METGALFFVAGGKAIIAIIAVLAVLIVGWAAWGWYRPEHLLNPINSFALFNSTKLARAAADQWSLIGGRRWSPRCSLPASLELRSFND